MQRTTRRAALTILGSIGFAIACSDDSDDGGKSGTDGGSGNGGAGGSGGTSGAGGSGGQAGGGQAGSAGQSGEAGAAGADAGTGSDKLSLAEREALELGTYIPGPKSTGLLPGWKPADLTPVYPPAGQNKINLTTAETHENKIFWGEVDIKAPVVFKNCMFAGQDPAAYASATGVIKCFGSGIPQWEAYDCVIDPGLWMDPSVKRPGDAPPTELSLWRQKLAWSTGVYGGSCKVVRCEITNVQDGFGFIQPKADANDPSFATFEGCWIHKMVFYKGAGWHQPEGTHSDAVQTHIGSNLTLRGNMLGGARDETGYDADPGYNAGDDAKNAALMLKQEQSNTDADRLENLLIEKNFWQGGVYCINHAFNDKHPNLFETTSIRDNFFIRRSDERYVIRTQTLSDCYSNNRVVDVAEDGSFTIGESIPYKNG